MKRFMKRAAIGLLCFVVAEISVHNIFSPTDWVDVTVQNLPADTRQIHLIADVSGHIQALRIYHSKVLPFTEGSGQAIDQWDGGSTKGQRFGSLQWPWADRYGAVAQREDKTWILWWFRPDDIVGPPVSRWIWGGTWAEITLPEESQAVKPTMELLQGLGLSSDSAS